MPTDERLSCPLAAWIGTECEACAGDGSHDVAGNPWECKMCHGTGRVNAHGIEIVRAAPIREVRLTDAVRRWDYGGGWERSCIYHNQVGPLWEHICVDPSNATFAEFDSQEHAEACVSAGAIRWARQRAGLTALDQKTFSKV